MKITPSERTSYWQSHIECWSASGQTQAEYCRLHNLKLHQFTYWRSKLKTESDCEIPPQGTRAAFIQATVASHQTPGLILCLPNGCRIEGITPASLKQVQQLLEMLM